MECFPAKKLISNACDLRPYSKNIYYWGSTKLIKKHGVTLSSRILIFEAWIARLVRSNKIRSGSESLARIFDGLEMILTGLRYKKLFNLSRRIYFTIKTMNVIQFK